MKRTALTLALVSLILFSIVAGITLVALTEAEEALGELYTYPISVGDETYIITVRSNYSSVPEVSYHGMPLSYSVTVYFRGDKENSFCNITIPTDLIWGKISVIDKDYIMSVDQYTLSNNGTHNSVYFTFNHPALVKHFGIKGTEGIAENPSSYSSPDPQPDYYIRFYAFTLYSPLNKTYNSKSLTLNLSFTGGMGVRYSLYYHLDGEYAGDIPWSAEGASEMHVTCPAIGSTQLPELSEGSHSLTVFLKGEGLVLHPSLYNGTVFFTIDSKYVDVADSLSAEPTPSPTSTPEPETEPFPTALMIVIAVLVIIATIALAVVILAKLLVYYRKNQLNTHH